MNILSILNFLNLIFIFLIIKISSSYDKINPLNHHHDISIRLILINFNVLIFLLIVVLVAMIVQYWLWTIIDSNIQSLKRKMMNMISKPMAMKKYASETTDLMYFLPLKSFKFYNVNRETTMETIEMLINEAKTTQRFSLVASDNQLLKIQCLTIGFIQPTSSIVIYVERFREYSTIYDKVDELISIILNPSNIIQTWGKPLEMSGGFHIFDVYLREKIFEIDFHDIQKIFKVWYNKTFPHHQGCNQMLDFIDIDGPLCSCPHRPLKFETENWSLSMAIMFTFYEKLEITIDHQWECLAITKLASVVQDEWTRSQVENLIRVPFPDRQVIVH